MLPNDVSNIITQLIYLPEIDIIRISQRKFVLSIKAQFVTIEIPLRTPFFIGYIDENDNTIYYYDIKNNNKIIGFVNDLNNGIDCIYDESDYRGYPTEIFKIGIVNNTIVINFGNQEIGISKFWLPIDCKSQLIAMMTKYYRMLNDSIKFEQKK